MTKKQPQEPESSPAEPAAQPKTPGQMFDAHLVEMFRPTVAQAFVEHGDVLRSVVVSFDYYGALNDADGLSKGMWLGPFGQVNTPDGIVGSAKVMVDALSVILNRAQQMIALLEQQMLDIQKQRLAAETNNDAEASETKG